MVANLGIGWEIAAVVAAGSHHYARIRRLPEGSRFVNRLPSWPIPLYNIVVFARERSQIMSESQIINKSMERDDLATDRARQIVAELHDLIRNLRQRDLQISSWYGKFDLNVAPHPRERMNRGYEYESLDGALDDTNFPWFLYWEIVWITANNDFSGNKRVLDLGGSSSLFSYYLASKGLDVTTVDLQCDLVENANHLSEQMGWKLKNHVMDMRELEFEEPFDHITSICVYEHIPMYARVEINRRIKAILVDGGKFSITFDYRNPSRSARIGSPADVHGQFVEPSGLAMRGNQEFADTGTSYLLHPFYHKKVPWVYKVKSVARGDFGLSELFRTKAENDYTFGALFLENR